MGLPERGPASRGLVEGQFEGKLGVLNCVWSFTAFRAPTIVNCTRPGGVRRTLALRQTIGCVFLTQVKRNRGPAPRRFGHRRGGPAGNRR